jgi:hypothetical protein
MMMMQKIKMYCLCLKDKDFNLVKSLGYEPVGLGNENYSSEWIRDNTAENISHKNKYYGEYTFHYWIWKNELKNFIDNQWVGFCAYRDYWSSEEERINRMKFIGPGLKQEIQYDNKNIKKLVVSGIPQIWNNYDTIIGEHLFLNNKLKMSKLLKKGIYALIKSPMALFKNHRTIKFHFDMFHGCGSLDKAINLLDKKERGDFQHFVNTNVSFNRGNMFICRSKNIIKSYYDSIFPWLEDCEKIFGFDLHGYGQTRIYAFLAERYLSYWFTKYTQPLLWPVIHFDNI